MAWRRRRARGVDRTCPRKSRCVAGFRVLPFFEHHRRVGAQLDVAMLAAEARKLRRQFPIVGIVVRQIVKLQRVFLGRRQLRGIFRCGGRNGRPYRGDARFLLADDAIEDAEVANGAIDPLVAVPGGPDRNRCRVGDGAFQFRRDCRILTAIRSALDRHPAAIHIKRVAVFRFASVVRKGEMIPGASLDRFVIRRLRANDLSLTINQPQPRHAFVDLENPSSGGDWRRALGIAGGHLTGDDQCERTARLPWMKINLRKVDPCRHRERFTSREIERRQLHRRLSIELQ